MTIEIPMWVLRTLGVGVGIVTLFFSVLGVMFWWECRNVRWPFL